MAVSARMRKKHMQHAGKLVPDAQITGYVIGRAGQNPVVVVGAMVGTAALFSIALVVATGQFVIIGILPMLIVQHFISPPRGIVVADRGVALTTRSLWTGRPNRLLGTFAHGYVQPTEESLGRVKVQVGNDDVWLAKNEEAELRRALGVQPSTAPPAAPAPPPPPSGSF